MMLSPGALNVYLRQKTQPPSESSVWTLRGHQGDSWRQAKINIHPTASFQVGGPGCPDTPTVVIAASML